jgi:hypothetical protein
MRCAELQHLARLFVGLAQIGIVVAQPVVMEGGGPVGDQRHQKQERRQDPSAHTNAGARPVGGERRTDGRHGGGGGEQCFVDVHHMVEMILDGAARKICVQGRYEPLNIC